MNWWYVAVLAACAAVPLLSMAYSEGRSRGNRPHGLFMIGVYALGVLLFAVGQARAHRYGRGNAVLVAAVFIAMTLAVGLLFLLNFGSNFSV